MELDVIKIGVSVRACDASTFSQVNPALEAVVSLMPGRTQRRYRLNHLTYVSQEEAHCAETQYGNHSVNPVSCLNSQTQHNLHSTGVSACHSIEVGISPFKGYFSPWRR